MKISIRRFKDQFQNCIRVNRNSGPYHSLMSGTPVWIPERKLKIFQLLKKPLAERIIHARKVVMGKIDIANIQVVGKIEGK